MSRENLPILADSIDFFNSHDDSFVEILSKRASTY